ncbi:hypothetical protein DXG01_012195 [Tephrocybe rancida]|nr:hypothetical protein DXG01_012195 [Tephrocybe rancida]
MSLAIGIWSLKLTPGKEEIFQPAADLQITNVALGDVLKDTSGRTSVKLTFAPSGTIDEDDEDEEVPDPVTTVLCSLKPDTFEQTSTNLILQEDETYKFELVGKNPEQAVNNPPFGDDDESDFDSDEDAYDLREVSSDVEMHPDDLDSDASRFEEVEDVPKSLKRARDAEEDTAKPTKAEKKKKKQKTEAAQPTEITKKEKEVPKDKEEAPKTKAVEKEIAGGIKILDSKIGTGPLAKKGNTVRMRYIGKLTSGKVFDKNVKGKPVSNLNSSRMLYIDNRVKFTFHLGKGEVIKGWDEGIVGMQVGGERKLTLPPAMAYGKNGTDGIPKNATLIFEVKLMEIK